MLEEDSSRLRDAARADRRDSEEIVEELVGDLREEYDLERTFDPEIDFRH